MKEKVHSRYETPKDFRHLGLTPVFSSFFSMVSEEDLFVVSEDEFENDEEDEEESKEVGEEDALRILRRPGLMKLLEETYWRLDQLDLPGDTKKDIVDAYLLTRRIHYKY
jgi:hypothetical protein